jgi:modification methylase
MLEVNKIYNMDCIEGMKMLDDNSIDMIITSPPYNKHKANGGNTVSAVVYDEYDDDMNDTEYRDWQIEVLNECHRVLKDGGCMFYNHKNRYVDGDIICPIEWIRGTPFTIRQEIIWDKMIAANLRGWRFWNVDERIYWLQKGKPTELKIETAMKSSIWRIRPQVKKEFGHPCGFPKELTDICISILETDGNIILDPFMGSGTTAVSALDSNNKYIGFEISAQYCDIADKRLNNIEEKKRNSLF